MSVMLAAIMALGLQTAPQEEVDPSYYLDMPEAERVALVEGCVTGPEIEETGQCIGVISRPCIALPGNDTTLGMVHCLAAEHRAWEVLMERWLARAAQDPEMDADARQALAESQTAWLQARESSIAVYSGRQGSIWGIIGADWWREFTARRALWLYDLAEGGGG